MLFIVLMMTYTCKYELKLNTADAMQTNNEDEQDLLRVSSHHYI